MKPIFLPFKKAKKFVRGLKIKGWRNWCKYAKSSQKPNNIPSRPDRHYVEWKSITDWLGYNQLPCGTWNRKYNINHNYFKKWSHDMAYILGFWFTDGCITNNKFVITQHKNERCLLEKMLKIMGANYPLTNNNACLFFAVSSKTIIDDIKKLGGTERKSLTIKFPNVPKKYLPDFIRGLWDGDGSIDKKRFVASFISGSKIFVDQLNFLLKKEVGLHGQIRVITVKKGNIQSNNKPSKKTRKYYVIQLKIDDSRKLRDFMYYDPNIIKMQKKYNIFMRSGEKRTFITIEKMKNIIKKLGVKNEQEWRAYKSNNKNNINKNIPLCPEVFYKNNGWNGWKDFLDTKFYSYDNAKNFLKKNNIDSYSKWEQYRSSDKSPKIPFRPNKYYKNSGWVGWDDFLNKIAKNKLAEKQNEN